MKKDRNIKNSKDSKGVMVNTVQQIEMYFGGYPHEKHQTILAFYTLLTIYISSIKLIIIHIYCRKYGVFLRRRNIER